MSNSKEILDRINSVKTMKQITQTMKLISISKFTKNKVELGKVRKYKSTLKNILEECKIENIDKTTCCKRLLIPISGNRGFCGAFNNNIYKKTIEFLKTIVIEAVDIISLGKKITSYLKKNGYQVIEDFVNILEPYNFTNIDKFAEEIVTKIMNKDYKSVIFIYNSFENASTTVVKIKEIKNINLGIELGKVLLEPDEKCIKKILIKKIIKTAILDILLQSNTAENSARMINMGKASDNADVLIKNLRILYNQTRQTAITNEIIEITNGSILKK